MAYEERRGNTWIAGLEYMHAANVGEARIHFGGSFMARGKGSSNYGKVLGLDVRIVGIARVIGAHALDDNADRLIV